MGDRNNPIKFGPEWLRNLSRERNAANSNNTNNSQNTVLGSLSRERYTASTNTASSNQSAASRAISRERAVTTDNTTNNSQNTSLGAIPRERNATSANTTNNNQNTALGILTRERNAASTNNSQNSTPGNILRVRNSARANNSQNASLGAIPREKNTTSTNTTNSNSNTALGTRERNTASANTANNHQNTASGTVSHERNATNTNNTQNIRVGSSSAAGATGAAGTGGLQSNSTTEPGRENQSLSQNITRVQLAKLRYGREEMLALYDRNIEPPSELRNMEILFKARGHQPAALANTFEERENIRNVQPSGAMPLGERIGLGRGYLGRGFMGRGSVLVEGRGRGRGSFIRQTSINHARSSWHSGIPRMPLYSANIDEETTPFSRSWNNSNNCNPTPTGTRNNGDGETTKTYRKRPGNSGNWRQVSREDSEEWRSGAGRSRPQDKWDWSERSSTDKGQSWNPNRRTWVGGEVTNVEDNLPEWAVDNAGACGGTFDSSGAFHGYSNDDSNLPRSQDNAYPLTRSHTHGSFVRQRTVEEGSEEWWDSEKAKKLSPKRFNAGDIKFKKTQAVGTSGAGPSGVNKSTVNDDNIYDDVPVRESDTVFNYDESSQVATGGTDKNGGNSTYVESKTFDSLMRSDINIEETNDDRGNFQSVMITPNNRLRQKHQNIVLPINEAIKNMNRKQAVLQLLRAPNTQANTSSVENTDMVNEDNIVDEMLDLTIDEKVLTTTASPMLNVASTPSGMPSCYTGIPQPMHQLPNPMQMGLQNQSLGLSLNQNNKPNMLTPVMQPSGAQSNLMQQVGITNSALNASLGLALVGANLAMPPPPPPPPVLPNPGMNNSGMGNAGMGANSLQGPVGAVAMQGGTTGLPGYPNPLSRMSVSEVGNNSLFMGQNSNNLSEIQAPNGFQLHNNARQNMFSVHGIQQSSSQTSFGNWNSNMMPQSAAQPPSAAHSLADQWYYEDPKQVIQGPFSSQEMFSWYCAGFFTSSLMVRRACDAVMRPLGSYGPIVPFAQLDMRQYQLPSDNMLNNQQSGLGLGVDSLWSQPTAPTDLMWMQHVINSRNETRVNNLPMYFWDQQPSAISSNTMLPDDIHKEMKTEDQILAQLRASQNISTPQTLSFMTIDQQCPETSIANKSNDNFNTTASVTPNLDELQKFIQKETLTSIPLPPPLSELVETVEQPIEATVKSDPNITETAVTKPATVTKSSDNKTLKQAKNEGEKVTKKAEKVKNDKTKKIKEEKKEELPEIKVKEKEKEETEKEKRSAEPSPSKSKKEEKGNKKDLEKEKKELVKDGFTMVKGSEKNVNKDSKKKAEDLKAAEEIERKKKEEEKLAAAEDKKKKQLEASKKQQEQQQQKQVSELVMKKAPWSAVSNQATQATNKDAITLAEIQRLEREKKLEQIKEQQHMMHIIAQQQAAALAREQEMQAGLNWAKKKPANNAAGQQTLVKIQAETRKQAVTSVATVLQGPPTIDESQVIVPTTNNHIPWGNNQNGGGFWDTQPSQNPKPEKSMDPAKTTDANKTKKKPTLITTTKKETSPAAEFESWCSNELISWSSKIDVPTFVGFLKDIESPYEVKDYVKCYLGESKDSSDFARQFLERRSKLLRVGMVTPSDDLCSPAIAVNPRTVSGSDYQEIKSKGKKIKKNKMQKIDSRILGFSVTAAEDRINVGDIDTV